MATSRRSWLLRIDSDPVCYLWTGAGDLDTPADAVDVSGARWKGWAGIITLPTLKALIGGVAERVEFVLSGVDPETLRLAQEDIETVDGASVRVGYVEFDSDWQLSKGPVYDWEGTADVLTIGSTWGDEGRTRVIRLSVASVDTKRANPKFSFWTSWSQRLRSSDDEFCDMVAMISNSITRRFGPK